MAYPGRASTHLQSSGGGSSLRRAALAAALFTGTLAIAAAQVGAHVAAATTARAFSTVARPPLAQGGCHAQSSACAQAAASAGDFAQGSWSALPGGPLQARSGQAAVWTGRQLLVWGGGSATRRSDGLPETVFANGASYDAATRQWQMMPGSPLSPRQGMAGVWAGDEAVFWGGLRQRRHL